MEFIKNKKLSENPLINKNKNENQGYNFTLSNEYFTMKILDFLRNGTIIIEFSENMID